MDPPWCFLFLHFVQILDVLPEFPTEFQLGKTNWGQYLRQLDVLAWTMACVSQWPAEHVYFEFWNTLLEPSSETANLNGEATLSTCAPNFLTCNEHQ